MLPGRSSRRVCEACGDPHVEWEEVGRLEVSEEWFCDECSRNARWRTRFAIVEEHVCDAHKPAEAPTLDAALGALGLGEASYLLGIKKPEACEGELLGPSCSRRATWAVVSIMHSFACDAHRPRAAPRRDPAS